jgi:hypothetical protein
MGIQSCAYGFSSGNLTSEPGLRAGFPRHGDAFERPQHISQGAGVSNGVAADVIVEVGEHA